MLLQNPSYFLLIVGFITNAPICTDCNRKSCHVRKAFFPGLFDNRPLILLRSPVDAEWTKCLYEHHGGTVPPFRTAARKLVYVNHLGQWCLPRSVQTMNIRRWVEEICWYLTPVNRRSVYLMTLSSTIGRESRDQRYSRNSLVLFGASNNKV